MVSGFLESFYGRLLAANLSPAYFTAFLAISLAACLLAVNYRRPANRLWALSLALAAAWQLGIGLAQIYRKLEYVEIGIFFGNCAIPVQALLFETTVAPWASLRRNLKRVRFQILMPFAGLAAFTRWYFPPQTTAAHSMRGPAGWAVNALALSWTVWYLVRCLRAARAREASARMRSELTAFGLIFCAAMAAVICLNATAWIFGNQYGRWLSPFVLWLAFLVGGALLLRGDALSVRTPPKTLVLFAARAAGYGAFSMGMVAVIAGTARTGIWSPMFFAIAVGLACGLGFLPFLDRHLAGLIDRSFTSERFLRAQMAANALIHSDADGEKLHDGFTQILGIWAEGSAQVFLSEGSTVARWPSEPIPSRLVRVALLSGAVTPEVLEGHGGRWRQEFDYLARNQVGGLAAAVTPSDETLIAAFQNRPGNGPFTVRELLEARELLGIVQIGFKLARLRGRLRGNDRLNFYARYAPQFAHELRNGLYLQTQVLRAIAGGRAADVLPSDAEASLKQTEQIDRLCEHFFNVGTLFNRPIQRLNLGEILETVRDRAGSRFGIGSEAAVHCALESSGPPLEILGNPELLSMALLNLIKNGCEAMARAGESGAVEVTASRQVEKIHIWVADTGGGLPPDRVKDPFAPGRSHKREGMGLGLSIVKDCVEAMGGAIGVRYTGRDGTCFEVSLVSANRLDGAAVPCSYLRP